MRFVRLLSLLFVTASTAAAALPISAPVTQVHQQPQLVDVRALHRGNADRVVFQFDAGVPSQVRVRYVDKLLADASGLPVRIAGRAMLEVDFQPTRWIGGTPAPKRRTFALPNVMTVVRSGLFEGVTTYGIGLAKRTDVRVVERPKLSRVVIVVRAAFKTESRKVYFFNENRFIANTEPFFVPRLRPVRVNTPATGVMDRLFAGPLPREKAHGLRLLRSRAAGFTDLSINDHIARIRLEGGCNSGGSTVTIAGEIMPSLRQFDNVDWVKIYGPGGHTADPTGNTDSIPACLNP